MKIQVHTDNHIQNDEILIAHVEESVEHCLGRFESRITRVEVFLADENSREKFGDQDKRCVMEARLAGMKPISVRHHESSVKESFEGAAHKLQQVLEKTLGRLEHRHEDHKHDILPLGDIQEDDVQEDDFQTEQV